MSDTEGRLQNLRDFTVQILHATTNKIVGTGIVVSMDGKIVTCAHVVLAAGVNPRLGQRIASDWEFILKRIFGQQWGAPANNGADVGVYFPEWLGRQGAARRATIASYFPQ